MAVRGKSRMAGKYDSRRSSSTAVCVILMRQERFGLAGSPPSVLLFGGRGVGAYQHGGLVGLVLVFLQSLVDGPEGLRNARKALHVVLPLGQFVYTANCQRPELSAEVT